MGIWNWGASVTTPENSPDAVPSIDLGPLGWLRWFWRQLTTMRVALQLLFLLAIAAIPGSIFPQRTTSTLQVQKYIAENPSTSPWLDRLGFFDVYGSVWFSAIYLLLMTSLVGCIIPRMGVHWRAMRSAPPVAPKNLTKLEFSSVISNVNGVEAGSFLDAVAKELKSRHWRVVVQPGEYVSAERGYLRETGNLIFHIAVVLILVSVAFGSSFGYRGQIIVRENTAASNVLAQYDSFFPGRLFNTDNLKPFNIRLDDLKVQFEDEGTQIGAARDFAAFVTYRESPDAPIQKTTIGVNNPLNVGDASLFLIGHGYAPHFLVKDASGNVVFDDTVVFLPQDPNFTSTGVVKIPDMEPQLGIQAIFAPTGVVTPERGPHSLFPDLIDPMLFMSAWTGDLGLDTGKPQNIYTLDKTALKRIDFEELSPGETWALPGGVGSVTFVGVEQFATFNIASDPGQLFALGGALLAILGVIGSLYIQRRRVWVRVITADGDTRVEIGAMSRYEDGDVTDVIREVETTCRELLGMPHSAEIEESSSHGH